MGYATINNARKENAQGGDIRIMRTEEVLGQLVNVTQNVQTETFTYKGLSKTDAYKLAKPYNQTTNPQGLIKTSLGGVKITVANAIGATAWFSVFACRGTIETAQAQRIGDSLLFNVVYTKQTLSVTVDNGTVTNI